MKSIVMHDSNSAPPPAGVPQGPGVGPSAAAELLEEAALPQGGEGRPADSTDAGEGHYTSILRKKLHQEVKRATSS